MRASVLGLILVLSAIVPAQTWTALVNPFSGHPDTALLLTDGTVMCHRYRTHTWSRLTPDINGSYVNGTWSTLATMPDGTDTSSTSSGTCAPCVYAPLYFASAVLADGRVVIVGGEYNTNGTTRTNIGFMFDPTTNAGLGSWSAQLSVPFVHVGDAQAVVLANGTMLVANLNNRDLASFDPATLTFTALNPASKADINSEEGWTILPDGRVLTVDTRIVSAAETYDPLTNAWTPTASTVVNLADTGAGSCDAKEIGPAAIRPDGTMICFSGNALGQNAIYDIASGGWSAGPTFPNAGETVADGPACTLPNGRVLVQASPVSCTGSHWVTPSRYYEFDGVNLIPVPAPPNGTNMYSYQGRMLMLPTGQVFYTGYTGVDIVQIYTSTGSPMNAWRPSITSAPCSVAPGGTYTISGTLFNGFSEGGVYGDDAQSSSNYPIVRITNHATGHVKYARTHHHSRMGVETVGSTEIITTQVDIPASLEAGPSDLVVIANGIASTAVVINDSCGMVTSVGTGCGGAGAPVFNCNAPRIGQNVTFTLAGATPAASGSIYYGSVPASPISLGSGCTVQIDLATFSAFTPVTADPMGAWTGTFGVPLDQSLVGFNAALQIALFPTAGPLGVDLSNGLIITIGN